MYAQKITFTFDQMEPPDEISDLANSYISILRMSGQICSSEWPLILEDHGCHAIVLTPEQCSLDKKFESSYMAGQREKMFLAGISVDSSLIGKDYDSLPECSCETPSEYVLFTTYVSIESPVRCLRCFRPTPLYRFPKMPSGEFCEVISWQSNYQACDRLQMNCEVLERPATKELSSVSSRLSLQGRQACELLSKLTGHSFFYYLYRGNGKSALSEEKLLCPVCSSSWRLPKPLHSIFHFKCDHCNLVSNFSWNLTRGT